MLVEHSVCHEPIYVLINVCMYVCIYIYEYRIHKQIEEKTTITNHQVTEIFKRHLDINKKI